MYFPTPRKSPIKILNPIIIIIKKGRQCKAERECYTPYQSEDLSPQCQPIDRKKRKGKRVEDYSIGIEQLRPIK